MLNNTHSKRSILTVYLALLVLVIVDRWWLLHHFTFVYVDDDQSIMWYGAREFATGNFHEPCFYGQPYNTMLESLVAVPLIWCGVSYPDALTVAMSFFTLFPFVLLSFILFRKEKYTQAFITLSILLLLSPQFGMITAISRGVVTGTFFAGFAILALFITRPWRFTLFGFAGMMALYTAASSIIVILPAGIWMLIENYQNRKFYWQAVSGALPAAALWILSNRFYALHPDYIVHPRWSLEFSFLVIKPYDWGKFFNYVTPIFWQGAGWIIFPSLIALAIVLLRQRQKNAAIALTCGAIFIFFSLGMLKVHEGFPTVFYSNARMFTSIPLLLALFIVSVKWPVIAVKKAVMFLLIPVAFFIVKISITPATVHAEVIEKSEHNMYVSRIDSLQQLCNTIQRAAQKNNVDLIVVGTHPTKHLINYACPCLNEDFPETIEPLDDRRTWKLNSEENLVRENVMLVGFYYDSLLISPARSLEVEVINHDPLIIIHKGNILPSGKMLDSLGIPMRSH